jgi:hypothetical protein
MRPIQLVAAVDGKVMIGQSGWPPDKDNGMDPKPGSEKACGDYGWSSNEMRKDKTPLAHPYQEGPPVSARTWLAARGRRRRREDNSPRDSPLTNTEEEPDPTR